MPKVEAVDVEHFDATSKGKKALKEELNASMKEHKTQIEKELKKYMKEHVGQIETELKMVKNDYQSLQYEHQELQMEQQRLYERLKEQEQAKLM